MSASLAVDLGNTCHFLPSATLAGAVSPASGTVVGLICDMIQDNTNTQVWVAGTASSGVLGVQVQTADVASGVLNSGGGFPISGAFTDPTSGLAAADRPSWISSGGIFWVNSGLVTLPGGGGASGPGQLAGGYPVNTFPFGPSPVFNAQGSPGFVASGTYPVFGSGGGMAIGHFLRPHRFARLLVLSGGFTGNVIAGFLANLKTTGSGGGFTFSPQTGSVNV